jgi:DNA-binding response OmpR family regulator
MVGDKILIIESSDLIKNYLKEKLGNIGFEIIFARDALDGLVKMKNNIPDLVIMDYFLTQNIKTNFFEEKRLYKTIADIPMIMLANKVDKQVILSSAKYRIVKFFMKPLKIDILLKSISEILQTDLDIDQTPCMIDIHLNEDMLFIEVASGLNRDKIESIKYKISEIKNLYRIDVPKVLLMMVDLKFQDLDKEKVYLLIDNIVKYANPHLYAIKILTKSDEVKEILSKHSKYSLIEVTDDINTALDKLGEIRIEDLISKSVKRGKDEEIFWANAEVSFDEEEYKDVVKKSKIAIVDDDELILELVKTIISDMGSEIFTYKDGSELIENLTGNKEPDLIFLDLMMPKMNGFDVLEYLKKNKIDIPVIIFSALTQKETVRKVLMYGVKSYIAKPVSPDLILRKTKEVLKSSF